MAYNDANLIINAGNPNYIIDMTRFVGSVGSYASGLGPIHEMSYSDLVDKERSMC